MFLDYLIVFGIGGFVCLLGQILVIRTKITTSRILVLFLMLGVVLGAFEVYKPIYEFAKAGISVPIIGFGGSLSKGAIEGARESGIIGALMGGLQATSAGIAAAVGFSFLWACLFRAHTKKIGK